MSGRIPPFTFVRLDIADGVATITLDRPQRRNAWSLGLAIELDRAMGIARHDDAVRAIVLTGAGDTFSVGADLAGGDLRHPGGEQIPPAAWFELQNWPQLIDKPVLAALNGDAVGGGITVSMLCDLRFVADDAKVGFVFSRRGVVAEMTAHWSLPRAVGAAVAQDLLLTGRVFRGREAVDLGVCHRAFPAAEVLPAALDAARELARRSSPSALAISKRLLWEDFNAQFRARFARETALLEWCVDHGDGPEGIASFLEHRDPRWRTTSRDLPPEFG